MSRAVVAEGKFDTSCPTAALVRVLSRATDDDFESVFARITPGVIEVLVECKGDCYAEFEYRDYSVEVSDGVIRVYE